MIFLLLSSASLFASQEQIAKANGIDIPKRPQEPTWPLPYVEEEVNFTNSSDGITLAGTLTLPRMDGPFPAVVLLHGSAPFDRNSSMYGHKPFLVWADYLTKQGIAVLRFDKRSAGKSTGNYDTSTLEDFTRDALAAVEYLKTRTEIKVDQIGLIGHSEGGLTASLAASRSHDIAFIILMASPCVNFEEIVLAQEEKIQRIDGVDEEMIAKSLDFRKQVLAILKQEEDRQAAETILHDLAVKYLSGLKPSQRMIAETYYGPMENQIKLFNSAWFRYALTYDSIPVLKQLSIPVLALNGELDFIVSCEQNLNRIAAAFEESNHTDYTIILFYELNHAFQTCQIGSLKEHALIEETVSPLVLETLTEWIFNTAWKIDRIRFGI